MLISYHFYFILLDNYIFHYHLGNRENFFKPVKHELEFLTIKLEIKTTNYCGFNLVKLSVNIQL